MRFFDDPVHLAVGELRGDRDGVLDGIGVGGTVTDDAHAFDLPAADAAVFGMIQPLLEVGGNLLRESEISDLGC